jgi:hypothetical protein
MIMSPVIAFEDPLTDAMPENVLTPTEFVGGRTV